jgi:hypothetical protein
MRNLNDEKTIIGVFIEFLNKKLPDTTPEALIMYIFDEPDKEAYITTKRGSENESHIRIRNRVVKGLTLSRALSYDHDQFFTDYTNEEARDFFNDLEKAVREWASSKKLAPTPQPAAENTHKDIDLEKLKFFTQSIKSHITKPSNQPTI